MSGLSSLISYSDGDDDDDEDEKTPPQLTSFHNPPSSSPTSSPLPPNAASSSSSSSSVTPPSPIPAASDDTQDDSLASIAALFPLEVPPSPSDVSTFLERFPGHLASLLSKKRSLPPSTPSLYAQLLAMPSFHNPYVFPRLLERYHVDQHVCALRPSAPALDSLEAITRDAEAEERQRRTRDAVEEEARIAALRRREDDDESARIRQRDEDRANAAAIVRASLNPPLPHHLKRPRDPSSSPSPSVAPPLPPSSAPLTADMEAKRREALRRVEEITKRLKL